MRVSTKIHLSNINKAKDRITEMKNNNFMKNPIKIQWLANGMDKKMAVLISNVYEVVVRKSRKLT